MKVAVTDGHSFGQLAQARQCGVSSVSGYFGLGDQTFELFVLRWQMVNTALMDRRVKLGQHAPKHK
jgi:hypothetical protein